MAINTVGIIGAGIMGCGIAQVSAIAGFSVVLVDVCEDALSGAYKSICSSLERQIKKGTLDEPNKQQILSRISTSLDYQVLGAADLVIEAATENLGLKLRILKQIDLHISANCLVASNTSSLSITELAAVMSQPDRFIGLHFFNPVPVMTLLEVVKGLQTSEETYLQILAFTQRIGKVAISAQNRPGFAVNRILCPMINEAIFVLQEGVASAVDIDTGMQLGCNQPLGPLALADLIGLDTLLAVLEAFYHGFNDSKYRPAPLLKEMVAAGYLGRKSGRGFHVY